LSFSDIFFFLLFVTWQLLNTIGRFELFPSAGTVVVFRFVLLYSGWSIPNEFGGLRHVRVKKWNTFSQISRQRGGKVKYFTSEHFRVSNLINHVTLRIKVKKKYSEWIWRFDAREGRKVKSSCKYPGSGKNERN
jgi:hypothetical protein